METPPILGRYHTLERLGVGAHGKLPLLADLDWFPN